MSDREVRSYQESEDTNEQASYPWTAQWMCTSCKSETKACGHVSIHYEEVPKHNDGVQMHPLFRGFGEVSASKRARKNNEGFTLIGSPKKLRKENWEGQSFPVFNVSVGSSLAKQNQKASTADRRLLSESNSTAMLGWVPADVWPQEAIPPLKQRQVKYHNFLDDSSPAFSNSSQDGAVRLDSKLTVHQFKCGSTSVPFFNFRDKEVNRSNSLLSPLHVANTKNYTSSTLSIHEENINSKLASRGSGCSLSRQNDVTLLQHGPSTSRKHVQETQSKSGVGLFPNQSTSSEVPRQEKAYHESYSAPSLRHAVWNTETMKICAAVDVEEESSRCLPKTTPFPRKTGGNLSEGGHMFGDTTVSTKLKGKSFCELLVSPEHSFPVKTGLKLLPYRSATDSEEEDVRDVKRHGNNLDHESSSETDTMDMDGFQFQDNFLGVASSPMNEDTEGGQKAPTPRSNFTSAREEIRGRPPFTKLPDMNEELPELAAYESLADERETGTSRTQSLDVEHLLAHAEQPTDSKSSASADGPQGLDPNFRWVKRLKLSASHFDYGTKSKKMGEACSHEKVTALYKKNMKCSVTNSQPAMGRFHGRNQMALDDTPMLLRNGDSSSGDSARTSSAGENIPLSHPWIRRWSHKVLVPNKNSEAAVVPQPQSPKATFDQFQKKQFPSIAAMALMGKAMNGFNPCEFAKMGSFVVWNTKEF